MKKTIIFITLLLFSLGLISGAAANVGVGISPSKMRMGVESGKLHEIQLTVFNPGDNPLQIKLVPAGEIRDMTTVSPLTAVLVPEPKPHALPIKNGQTFTVTFQAPTVRKETVIRGTISATGSPTAGSQFGGSVGVATQIELIVKPPTQKPSPIRKEHIIIAALVLLLILIIILLKKSGIKLTIQRKKKK